MKKLTLVFSSLLLFLVTAAQDKIPAFGKIDKADLEMKDCNFDPGAEAVVLIDIGEMQFAYVAQVGLQSETDYRARIKILKASAVDRANIKLKYYTKNRYGEVTNLNGVSYNLDASGNVIETKLEKTAIFKKIINDEYSEISFALPNVKVGTVFEYKYKLSRRSFGYIPAWNFQQKIPVKYSAYRIIIPQYFQFNVQTVKRQELEQKNTKTTGTWYIMENVPALKEEFNSPGLQDYLQRIEFQLSKIDAPGYYYENTWPKIIERLLEDEDFGGVLKKNIKTDKDLENQLDNTKSLKEKARAIYKYVQSNMQWNEVYSFSPENIFDLKDAWDKKNGTIADINFILIHLLRNAGIDAKPLLASTKDNGTINTSFPFINQFNCVLAYVKDGDNRYIMNAADKYNSFDLVPYDVLNTNALIVDKKEGRLIGISNNKQYSNNIYFSAAVEADGKIAGNATINSSGYARNIRMKAFKKDKLKEKFQDNEGINITVDSVIVNNQNDELLPLEQNVQFSGSIYSSGEYYFLPYNIFTGIEKNPFTEKERITDIDFNYPRSYAIMGSYILADKYIVSDLPKNTKIIMQDTSIILTRMMQLDGNVVSFRFNLDFKAPVYTAENYSYLKEFFKKMYELLNERIVLKKK
jgi:hypothetical protein